MTNKIRSRIHHRGNNSIDNILHSKNLDRVGQLQQGQGRGESMVATTSVKQPQITQSFPNPTSTTEKPLLATSTITHPFI